MTNLKNALELFTLFAYGETALDHHQAPPESAEIHFLLGQCHTEMCDHTQALLAYNEALKVCTRLACLMRMPKSLPFVRLINFRRRKTVL